MNGAELQEHARERVRGLPGADLEHPFGPEVDDLVTDSYLLVVENLPRAKRPVDPATFGRDVP